MLKRQVWNSIDLPYSLVCVGSEAVATQNHNVICFTDKKTKTDYSYHASTVAGTCGVSIIAGHPNLALFAFAETTIRPIIRVVNYPDFNVISEFDSLDVIEYVDLCFSRGEYLIAQTSYPNYTIRVLNFRLNQLIVELETHKTCLFNSLLCSNTYLPTIVQFSKGYRMLYFYDLCYQTAGHKLVELSNISIQADQDWSDMCNKCFSEDNTLYMVNDYGAIFSVDIGLFYMKNEWSLQREMDVSKPRRYLLQNAKRDLIIASTDSIYFIKRKANEWQEEFRIVDVHNTIKRLVSDCNGDAYMINSYSNVYSIDNDDHVDGKGVLNPISTYRFEVKDFTVLQGTLEEIIVILTTDNELRAFNLHHMLTLSQLTLGETVNLISYPKEPFIIVATEKCQLQFLSYAKPSEPNLLGSVDLYTSGIKAMKICQNFLVIRDVFETLIIVNADFKKKTFRLSAYFEKPIPEMVVLDFFVISVSHIIVLFTLEANDYLPYANQMFLYKWSSQKEMLEAQRYELPFNYVKFAMFIKDDQEMFNLYGARCHDVIIDVFNMNDSGSLKYADSIQTEHLCYIYSLSLNRHLITSSVNRTYISLRSQNKAKKSFISTKLLDLKFVPTLPTRIEECFSGRYLLSLHQDKCLQVQKLTGLTSDLKENTFLQVATELEIIPLVEVGTYKINLIDDSDKPVPTEMEINKREELLQRIGQLAIEVTELINYDISVAGITPRIFRKFCLNIDWLENVTREAENVCSAERHSLDKATQDVSRIRDWIFKLIFKDTEKLSSKIRAIFTNVYCENYSNKHKNVQVQKEFDLFRFHDMEQPDDELDELIRDSFMENRAEDIEEEEPQKAHNIYNVQGKSVYAHIMSDEFCLQSKSEISYFEMHNTCTKFKLALNNPLKDEFNKFFQESVELKHQIIDNIKATNYVLYKIYDNMNIMRRLLGMEGFIAPELSMPQWTPDENIDSILTLDDSEIKAINRRKKKAEMQDIKSGRMLLWEFEFWERALITMMDGVLEKLWEEEIKKNIPVPEFSLKKEPHEFNITEQRQYREYLDKVRILKLDRRKYLNILDENEIKAMKLKKNFILKLNERITHLSIEKLKYDFALKRCRLQLINTKIIHFKRIQYIYTMNMLREDFEKITNAINNASKVCGFWEKSVADIKNRFEIVTNRERSVERHFRAYFLNTISSQFIPEMRRLYKKTPKINKTLISVMICDVIKNVIRKGMNNFSIPQPAEELLKLIEELDQPHNMPNQFDLKHWEQFTKLRRQKIEVEFTVKAISLKLLEIQNAYQKHTKNQNMLKYVKTINQNAIDKTKKEYIELLHNRSLVITLTLGQVEVKFSPSTRGIGKSVLMRIEDINNVNAKIKAAGLKKLRAMQRVATFRRQVISKEWEHEVTKANIAYLKYMLEIIEKSKVTIEFLSILRNWDKIQAKRKVVESLALIDKEIEQKIIAANINLQRYIEKKELVREKIKKMKQKNAKINRQIQQLKIEYAFTAVYRDNVTEERRAHEQRQRMTKIKVHRNMMETVRADYVRILELKTILELQRLRTYPTLGPASTKMSTSEGSVCL